MQEMMLISSCAVTAMKTSAWVVSALWQGVDVDAAGGDAGDVCGVDEAFELVGVLFDDDDVVLVGEFLADDAADLADANDNDMHG